VLFFNLLQYYCKTKKLFNKIILICFSDKIRRSKRTV